MRRVTLTVAVTGAVLFGTAGSSQAACEFPKGWYTAQAEMQYATDLYFGKLQESLGAPANTSNLLGGNVTRTSAFAAALSKYVRSLPANRPSCRTR